MPRVRIPGLYFDGATSEKREVTLYYDDDGRVGVEEFGRQPIAIADLSISARIGNTARYIGFPDGGEFETHDNDAVDGMCRRLGYRDPLGFVHILESRKRFVLMTLLVVVAFTWSFVQYGIPLMSRQLAMKMPVEVSRHMGRGMLDTLDKQWLKPSALPESRREELQTLFDGYARSAGEHLHLNLVLRKGGPLKANAFALPDGTIMMTDELVTLADDDREIGAVMLHEIGHVQHRHSLRTAIQQFSLSMVVMAVSGDVSASSSAITALPVFLVTTGYSRDMEWEADGYALDHMHRHAIDPEYFATMMDKLEARYSTEYETCIAEDTPANDCLDRALHAARTRDDESPALQSYFSTHPMSKARAARFRQDQPR